MDSDLYGGRPPFVIGSDTSEGASDSLLGITGKLRRQVFEAIWNSSAGMICDEVECQLDMKHQTASARIRELSIQGHIVDTGKRRPTRSNRPAVIWMAVRKMPKGQQPLF